jgi:virginiamycin B lyase
MRGPSRSLLVAIVGVVMVLAALLVVGRVSSGRLDRPASSTTTTIASLPEADHPTTTAPSPVVARISFGEPVDGVAASPQALWVAHGGMLGRVDPRTRRVTATVPGARRVVAVSAGAGAVWASTGTWLLRVDPRRARVATRVAVATGAAPVAVGAGGVWAVCCVDDPPRGRGRLSRVDPVTNRVVATIQLPGWPDAVGAGPSGVWVRGARGPVWQVDPASNRVVATIGVPGGLGRTRGSVVVTSQAVWVSDPANTALVQLDPRRGQVVERWEAAGGPLAVLDGRVWTAGDGGLLGYGRGRLKAVAAAEITPEVAGLAVGPGGLWAATPGGLLSVDPRKLR